MGSRCGGHGFCASLVAFRREGLSSPVQMAAAATADVAAGIKCYHRPRKPGACASRSTSRELL